MKAFQQLLFKDCLGTHNWGYLAKGLKMRLLWYMVYITMVGYIISVVKVVLLCSYKHSYFCCHPLIIGNEASLDTQKHIKTTENVSYELPPSRIKTTENVAYELPPSRIKTTENVAYELPPSRIKTTENAAYEDLPSRIKTAESVAYELPSSRIKTAEN